jgi:hypothetical protein
MHLFRSKYRFRQQAGSYKGLFSVNKGRISVRCFGHIDPLLAFPAVLRFAVHRNTGGNRISPAENNKC